MGLKVLTVTNMWPTAEQPSFGSFVRTQHESLLRAGVEAELFFVNGRASRWNYLRAVGELEARLFGARFDLLHAHYGLTGWVACSQWRTPVVLSFCGDDLQGTPSTRRPGHRTALSVGLAAASQVLAEEVDAIIVKSEGLRRRLWTRRSRERAHVIPNGVDLELLQPRPREESLARLGGLDLRKRYVLFPHTAHLPNKRLDLAQAAVRALGRPEVELLVVYDRPPELMPDYYSLADAMLLTSEREGSPNTVKEALAMNLPVISVDVGDVRERLLGLPACAVVERDPAALAAALAAALDAPRPAVLRARVEPISSARVAERIIAVYRQVLAERTAKAGGR